jgi:DNA-directed RNA polymerase specialized sigma24 family protein
MLPAISARHGRSSLVDPDAIATLADRGFRYALALTGDHDRAADVLQDAWLAMLRAGGQIGPGYLFAAIRSRICDQARRPRLIVISDPAELPEPAVEPEADTQSLDHLSLIHI